MFKELASGVGVGSFGKVGDGVGYFTSNFATLVAWALLKCYLSTGIRFRPKLTVFANLNSKFKQRKAFGFEFHIVCSFVNFFHLK